MGFGSLRLLGNPPLQMEGVRYSCSRSSKGGPLVTNRWFALPLSVVKEAEMAESCVCIPGKLLLLLFGNEWVSREEFSLPDVVWAEKISPLGLISLIYANLNVLPILRVKGICRDIVAVEQLHALFIEGIRSLILIQSCVNASDECANNDCCDIEMC
ncbi:hypothetical protein AVEN_177758-1 [Araneus ventricosus]|uniref:Uncharacterized protein n=1 Tax=Araneus ventricosus TaxID=182803 RepID=A0A4Y2NQJ0_ARAVE|nr:hypothetical protein AVEN_210362-1 [Araneus ventricosus]GBN40287.1 hypothetical protein AVEN_177758-1 [Araneus ventricosus]